MDRRLDLHKELVDLAGPSFTVYFQPPTNTAVNYPCVIYQRDSGDSTYADNGTYRFSQRYQVSVITRDPDCQLPREIVEHFRMCRMDRTYTAENLYHTTIVLYF